MADKKISELTNITGANVDDANDELTIVDSSEATTKAITREELFKDIDGNITLSGTVDGRDVAADGTKLDYISVTQAVDLDQLETDIAALANGMVYKGDWDASSGSFPGSGGAQTGWFYYVSTGGTVDGVSFSAGDNIVATTDNASASTYSGNWSKHDQTDAVSAVVGLTGSVSKGSLLSALNVEDGADVTDTANVTAAGALMDSELTDIAAVKGLDQGVATTDSPSFVEGTFSGDLTVDSDTLFVDASTSRVGIGTSSPSARLEVLSGDNEAVNIKSDGHIQLYDSVGTFLSRNVNESMVGGNIRLDAGVTTGSHVGYSNGANARGGSGIVFDNTTGGSSAYGEITFLQSNDTNDDTWVVREAMRIDSSGNVGIGNGAPQAKLDVNGAIAQRPLSADPADPAPGHTIQWVSDGTGSGDAGDVMMKINVGGTVKTTTLVDYSAL